MGGPRKLTESQHEALQRVAEQTEKIKERERWLADVRAREVEPLQAGRDRLVSEAVAMGVPKSWLYTQEVLGTLNPYAVTEAITRHETRLKSTSPEVVDLGDGLYRLELRSFTSVAASQPDYPTALEGTVRRDVTKRSGWAVVVDKSDTVQDGEVMPGFLTWELDRGPEEDQSLAAFLDRHIATATAAAAA